MTNKLLLIAAAAGTLAFTSCQNETGGEAMNDEMMQAKIDSAVQARMAEMQAQLAAQNDSLINAMALIKADSIMAARGTGATTSSRTPTRPTRPTTTTTNTTPAGTRVTDRPGADKGGNKTVTDRPGADQGGNKSVSDRPGATKGNQ